MTNFIKKIKQMSEKEFRDCNLTENPANQLYAINWYWFMAIYVAMCRCEPIANK